MSYSASDIWVQPIPSGEATRLTFQNYLGISNPAWTADGREIIFATATEASLNSAFFRVPLAGGKPQAVAGVGEGAGDVTIWRNYMVFAQWSHVRQNIWPIRGPNYTGKDRSPTPLLRSIRQDCNPQYSPDGKKLAFHSNRSGFFEIWICNSDGSKPVQLTYLRKTSSSFCWSPDSRRIVFTFTPEESNELYVMDAEGGIPRPLTNDHSQGEVPSWSRDGRWIYFASNRSGTYQVWKMPSEGGKAVQITRGGGFYAVESFDGKMLYYQKPGQQSHGIGPIWKVPREGGEETPVIDRETPWRDWALRPEGIYFATQSGKEYLIEFLRFQTGKIAPFYQEETPNRRYLSVSSDGEWFVYTEWPPTESDLMLVENFR